MLYNIADQELAASELSPERLHGLQQTLQRQEAN
jgi:hypothetical protein